MKFVLVAALLVGAVPAEASDFGKLANPGYGRLALISDKRQHERSCAGLALHEAAHGRAPGKAAAEALAAVVSDRLGSDIGDRALAEELVSLAAGWWESGTQDPKTLAGARRTLMTNCAGMFRAAASGRLDNELSPGSETPLGLPDMETCLAYAAVAKTLGSEHRGLDLESYEELREMWLGEPGAHRAARERSLASKLAGLDPKPSPDRIEAMLAMGCMPAIAELAKRNPPPPEPTEVTEP